MHLLMLMLCDIMHHLYKCCKGTTQVEVKQLNYVLVYTNLITNLFLIDNFRIAIVGHDYLKTGSGKDAIDICSLTNNIAEIKWCKLRKFLTI